MDLITILTECLIHGVKFKASESGDLIPDKDLSALPAPLLAEVKAKEADLAWMLDFERPALPFGLWKYGFPDYVSAERYAVQIYFCRSWIATDNNRQCFAVVEPGFLHTQENIEKMRKAVQYRR